MNSEAGADTGRPSIGGLVARLARRLRDPEFPTGDHAALRRLSAAWSPVGNLGSRRRRASSVTNPPMVDRSVSAVTSEFIAQLRRSLSAV